MEDFDLPAHGEPTDFFDRLLKVANLEIGDELPKDRLLAWRSSDFRRMDYRQIERRIALLLPDRRADVDLPIVNIKGHALDSIVIDSHLDTMHTGTRSLTHFALHGMVAAAGKPIDNGANDEVGAKIFGQAIEF